MRVLFITNRFPPQVGGAGVSADRLSRALAKEGHLVHVLHLGADAEPGSVRSRNEDGTVVHRLGALPAVDMTMQFADSVVAQLQEQVGFDIFHGHFLSQSGYLAAFEARRFGAKSYVSVRGNDIDKGMFDSMQFPFVLWTLQNADAVGCVSRELAGKCAALCSRDNIHFTPNSVDSDVFRPYPPDADLLESLQLNGEALLGFIGELRFKKGTQFILEAFRAVHDKRPARLLLIGGMRGEDKTGLRHFLRRYPELRPDIHVMDYIQDRDLLARWYSLMDLVLVPSLWDGMPNSALEAMSCGRVVIGSKVGGIRDLITHGETGFLVDVPDLHRLGEGCLEILEAGPELRHKTGDRARQHVIEHHSPEAEIGQLLEIYASLG